MPELPEVQTTVNGLQKIINKHIVGILINTRKLRYIVPRNLKKIGQTTYQTVYHGHIPMV